MSKRSKQLEFSDFEFNRCKDYFGGSFLKNSNAKVARPLDSKLPIHLVLKAFDSSMRLPKNFKRVNDAVHRVCHRHGVRLYRYSNNGNHLHLIVKIPGRPRWAAFIRELSGLIAQVVQALPGKQRSKTRFWRYKPFTRIVRGWRKAFKIACEYVELNILEAEQKISKSQARQLKYLRAAWPDG